MIAIIVAYSKNRVIGKDGKIPWTLQNEKKRFKSLTTGNVVIMGRKTYEEIGRPLPNRTTIVVSRTKCFDAENCMTAKSLSEALGMCEGRDVFISGGAELYKEALDIAEKLYITEIDADIEGDTYFPELDKSRYDIVLEGEYSEELCYRYLTYTKKSNIPV